MYATQHESIEDSYVDTVEEIIDDDPQPSPSAIIVISVKFDAILNKLCETKILIIISFAYSKDDRDDIDGQDKDLVDSVELDTNEQIETIEPSSDPVYDYQLDIDCDDMPITIDELTVNNNSDTKMEIGKLLLLIYCSFLCLENRKYKIHHFWFISF